MLEQGHHWDLEIIVPVIDGRKVNGQVKITIYDRKKYCITNLDKDLSHSSTCLIENRIERKICIDRKTELGKMLRKAFWGPV